MSHDENFIDNRDSINTDDEPKILDEEQNELNRIQKHLTNMRQNNDNQEDEEGIEKDEDDDDEEEDSISKPKPSKRDNDDKEELKYEEYGFANAFNEHHPVYDQDDHEHPGVIEQFE